MRQTRIPIQLARGILHPQAARFSSKSQSQPKTSPRYYSTLQNKSKTSTYQNQRTFKHPFDPSQGYTPTQTQNIYYTGQRFEAKQLKDVRNSHISTQHSPQYHRSNSSCNLLSLIPTQKTKKPYHKSVNKEYKKSAFAKLANCSIRIEKTSKQQKSNLRSISDLPPPSEKRVERVPFYEKYTEWQPRQVVYVEYFPVQKIRKNYYTIEHIIDYQPVQSEQVEVEYKEEVKQRYRLVYQPIQTRIVHIPKDQKARFSVKDILSKKTIIDDIYLNQRPKQHDIWNPAFTAEAQSENQTAFGLRRDPTQEQIEKQENNNLVSSQAEQGQTVNTSPKQEANETMYKSLVSSIKTNTFQSINHNNSQTRDHLHFIKT